MKHALWLFLLFAGLAGSSAPASDVAGSWKTVFVGGVAWKTIGEASFEFNVHGDKLTGSAHVGYGWPGTAPISEGTIDGERVSFLVLGKYPSSDGYPRMRFIGEVHRDELKLTMTIFYSDDESENGHIGKSDFKGNRIAK